MRDLFTFGGLFVLIAVILFLVGCTCTGAARGAIAGAEMGIVEKSK